MLRRILIANRGEIALRILRSCRELGIEAVCVYSTADRDAIYLRQADESICIGPGPAASSYLDIPRIIAAAEIADVEAIHPGYGFLAENDHFAEVCRSCGIGFIGPPPEVIAAVGNKARARAIAIEAGVPVLPGSGGPVADVEQGLAIAREIGFPVMIKAAAGGGGRGMRLAHNELSFQSGFVAARTEAEAAFKDGSLYLEKCIEGARHIEVQVLADAHGNVVHLGERDCSLQRRHQKLVEEAPSPFVDDELRTRMGEAAVRLAAAAGYQNAGTVEFLVDSDRNFYFIEMNARIQVEHPVTEMVCGVDLIAEQIRIASGAPLRFGQQDMAMRGAAIECRINAEDPDDDFRPDPGTVTFYAPPGGRGVRLDSHVYAGYRISPLYDSMVAKLIAYGRDREEAIAIMGRALA
ncbi:MAG: acetyl-CoA carboxylase biotin carboxylase subunit, partial [Planctomycetota bacterium]